MHASIEKNSLKGLRQIVLSTKLNTLDNTIANPAATPNSTTEYIVLITDANGCMDSDTVTVTVTADLIADAGADKAFCEGQSAQIGGSPTASGGNNSG